MEQLQFKYLNRVQPVFVPKIILTVMDLMRHDMIYIYHFLNEKSELELKESKVKGKYWVYFKSYKLGYINCKKPLSLNAIKVKISHINKEKYLPIQAIDIEVSY